MLLFIVTRVCSKRKGVSNEASGMRRKSVSKPNRPPDLATELTVNFIQLISYCTLASQHSCSHKRHHFHVQFIRRSRRKNISCFRR